MDSRSCADRSARVFFAMRLRQLWREPACWLTAVGGTVLAAFSTFLGPLPPLDGGLAWRELLAPCGLITGWVLALFLVWSPTGRLWHRLGARPIRLGTARAWWVLAEALVLVLGVLPALILGCAVLPGGPSLADGLLAGSVLGQVLVLGTVGAWARDQGLGFAGGMTVLAACLILFSVPPLSSADPRPLQHGAVGAWVPFWSLLFWCGLWIFLLGVLQALLFFAGRPGGH